MEAKAKALSLFTKALEATGKQHTSFFLSKSISANGVRTVGGGTEGWLQPCAYGVTMSSGVLLMLLTFLPLFTQALPGPHKWQTGFQRKTFKAWGLVGPLCLVFGMQRVALSHH